MKILLDFLGKCFHLNKVTNCIIFLISDKMIPPSLP